MKLKMPFASVVGAVFLPMLHEKDVVSKYRKR